MAQFVTYDVIWSVTAIKELELIWEWNAGQYEKDRADRYTAFLMDCVDALAHDWAASRPVHAQPGIRYIIMKWRPRGHGHIAVFELQNDLQRLEVLHIFHTRQNWQQILADEEQG